MAILEDVKKLAEQATGVGRPMPRDLPDLVRARKPGTIRFTDDGSIPNHPRWPLVRYRGAVRLTKSFDPAAIFEALFERNGWSDSWRNGVYDYLHYHSRIHEVMGVARGTAVVQFGGQARPQAAAQGGRRDRAAGRHRPPVLLGERGLSRRRRLSGDGKI